jgi:protein-tyrosine phosphatase
VSSSASPLTVVGFIDLHCHWVAGIDDGARTPEHGVEMLRRLKGAGFSTVVATPHMRPGMFDNDKAALERAYAAMVEALPEGLPQVGLASEHFFDDVVFGRLKSGQGVPYPGGKAVLVELSPHAFPIALPARLLDLRRSGLKAVIAHPERYQPTWKDTEATQPLLDAGACLLLDVCALVGKYGEAPKRAAEKLLDEDAYEAACSDAHRAEDADVTARAIERLRALVGDDETDRLMRRGPEAILRGEWS